MRRDGRVDHYGPANYEPASPTAKWLTMRVGQVADAIIAERKAALKSRVGVAPHHLPH